MSTELPTGQPTNELLQRILKAVEPGKRNQGFEIACAVILALTTTASAWCAYQSKLWGGAQASRGGAGAQAARDEAIHTLTSSQGRAFDASMFISYMQARVESNKTMESFLEQRFRPDMKAALTAWLKLDPLNNPSAPLTPFHMAEYAQKDAAEIARLEAIGEEAGRATRQARQYSDNYVLLTVLFASVLFFGGIARNFESRPVRIVLATLSLTLFLCTLSGLITMPICHE
jgi:hypothetical protein